jgi:hypothetical protein|tara:strand:- start:156 stop:335 length:180 start_codon:yes stop_codon:yes gene_type:complete
MPNKKTNLVKSTSKMTRDLEPELIMYGEGRPRILDVKKAQKDMAKKLMSRAAKFKKYRR